MRPINSKYFGSDVGKIKILFYNSGIVVSGYIVKQIGISRFIVSDGSISKSVQLTQSDNMARLIGGELSPDVNNPLSATDGYATIVGISNGSVKYIKRMTQAWAFTTSNDIKQWNSISGGIVIQRITAMMPSVSHSTVFSKKENSMYYAVIL